MNVFDPLLTYDSAAKKYVPMLATDWQVEGTKWTFHLRDDVKFQSGNPFTSADVVHTVNRIKNDPDSLQAANLDAVASVEAPDDHTVVMNTKKPNATTPDSPGGTSAGVSTLAGAKRRPAGGFAIGRSHVKRECGVQSACIG